jgi:hypothetical protein
LYSVKVDWGQVGGSGRLDGSLVRCFDGLAALVRDVGCGTGHLEGERTLKGDGDVLGVACRVGGDEAGVPQELVGALKYELRLGLQQGRAFGGGGR